MKEIKILSEEKTVSAFLQDGFFDFKKSNKIVHSHIFGEIHLILDGKMTFYINDEIYILKENTGIFIPAGYKHFFRTDGNLSESVAFQIDIDEKKVKQANFSTEFLTLLKNEISLSSQNNDYKAVAGLLSFVCAEFTSEKYSGCANINSEFIIKEFFSRNYMCNVTIKDLAEILGYSPRHTERCVKNVTGMTFRENIIFERKEAAEYLKKYLNLSKPEISEAVGYKTYAGFYKMEKKQK